MMSAAFIAALVRELVRELAMSIMVSRLQGVCESIAPQYFGGSVWLLPVVVFIVACWLAFMAGRWSMNDGRSGDILDKLAAQAQAIKQLEEKLAETSAVDELKQDILAVRKEVSDVETSIVEAISNIQLVKWGVHYFLLLTPPEYEDVLDRSGKIIGRDLSHKCRTNNTKFNEVYKRVTPVS